MDLIVFTFSLLPLILYCILKTKRGMLIFQQNRYNQNNWYIHWILKNKKYVFCSLDISLLLVILIGNFIFEKFLISTFFIWSIVVLLVYYLKNKDEKLKTPLSITNRVKRLFVTIGVLYLITLIVIWFVFLIHNAHFYYFILALLVYLNHFIIFLSNIINKPIEEHYRLYFKKEAMSKLEAMTNTEVIGITGSYGKTSSKNALNDILNIKYKAFKTPLNYNTESGLCLTINNHLDKFNDYFIAEMGAFKKDEIKNMCEMVKPKYGILTIIGKAHLESFGSQENILNGKFALIESLPSDGIGILNKDDELQVSYELKNDCKIIWIGIEQEADFRAINIKCNSEGTMFDIIIEGKTYDFKTKLLGNYNVYNILASVALGYNLGISIEDMQKAVMGIKAVEHRLELKRSSNYNIIDDAYNSNPKGFKMALDVLAMMDGKKIIVTPGMIELGDEQYSANKEVGEYMASICDEIILVGLEQTVPIQDGLNEKGYKNIHIVDSVNDAFDLILELKDENTYVLLENDLPDIF